MGKYYKESYEQENYEQEVIDCFWIKLSERVHLNNTELVDQSAWGMTAVPFSSTGQFAKGDAINQWVQQVTVGGYKANDSDEPEPASNKVTLLCLHAARRLPLNAPCLSLRVHKGMDPVYLEEAARAILSGGGHPILIHDDRIIPGLIKLDPSNRNATQLTQESENKQVFVALKDARNYACDGCYEPMMAGSSEFGFMFLNLLQVLEMTLNQGCTYSQAGPVYLGRGMPNSLPTLTPLEFGDFNSEATEGPNLKTVLGCYEYHLKIQMNKIYQFVLSNYGNLWDVCPSPLLSTMIKGCIETRRDLTNGGAQHHIVSLMQIGFANTVDSLFAIKKLCFDIGTSVFLLDDMLLCLKNDWGFDMKEPYCHDVAGAVRGDILAYQYQSVRNLSLQLPKFGTVEGSRNEELAEIVGWLSGLMANMTQNVIREPEEPLASILENIKKKYGTKEVPFEFLVPPGSGTFEGYVGLGEGCGASADGRRNNSYLASDMSAVPTPQDLPVTSIEEEIYRSVMGTPHIHYG